MAAARAASSLRGTYTVDFSPVAGSAMISGMNSQPIFVRSSAWTQVSLVQEATARSQEQDWRDIVPRHRLWTWVVLQAAAMVMFTFALGGLRIAPVLGEKPAWVSREGVAVTPGDTALEKGESLVVLARFSGALPPSVNLVVRSSGASFS